MHTEARINVGNIMCSVHGNVPLTATLFTAKNSSQASGLNNVLHFSSVLGHLKC